MTDEKILERINPVEKYKPYIFISYSSKDAKAVREDVFELQKRGYNIWIDDRNIHHTNDSWKEDAINAIKSRFCYRVLFYVSEYSLCSSNCYEEIKATREKDIFRTHTEPVPIICIDLGTIGDIREYCGNLFHDVNKQAIPENQSEEDKKRQNEEISEQLATINRFRYEFFKDNNERVRIHPKNEPGRKSDYYADIIRDLPEETLLEKGKPSSAILEDININRNAAHQYEASGDICMMKDDPASALAYYLKSIDLYLDQHGSEDSHQLMVSYHKAGQAAEKSGDYSKAEEYYLKSQDITENEEGSKQDLSDIYAHLARLKEAAGKPGEAAAYYLKSVEVIESLINQTQNNAYRRKLAFTYERLGFVYESTGEYQKAGAYCKQVCDIRNYIAQHTGTVEARTELSSSYMHLGNIEMKLSAYDEAAGYYQKSFLINESIAKDIDAPEYKWQAADAARHLGDAEKQKGNAAEADQSYLLAKEYGENAGMPVETITEIDSKIASMK